MSEQVNPFENLDAPVAQADRGATTEVESGAEDDEQAEAPTVSEDSTGVEL